MAANPDAGSAGSAAKPDVGSAGDDDDAAANPEAASGAKLKTANPETRRG